MVSRARMVCSVWQWGTQRKTWRATPIYCIPICGTAIRSIPDPDDMMFAGRTISLKVSLCLVLATCLLPLCFCQDRSEFWVRRSQEKHIKSAARSRPETIRRFQTQGYNGLKIHIDPIDPLLRRRVSTLPQHWLLCIIPSPQSVPPFIVLASDEQTQHSCNCCTALTCTLCNWLFQGQDPAQSAAPAAALAGQVDTSSEQQTIVSIQQQGSTDAEPAVNLPASADDIASNSGSQYIITTPAEDDPGLTAEPPPQYPEPLPSTLNPSDDLVTPVSDDSASAMAVNTSDCTQQGALYVGSQSRSLGIVLFRFHRSYYPSDLSCCITSCKNDSNCTAACAASCTTDDDTLVRHMKSQT